MTGLNLFGITVGNRTATSNATGTIAHNPNNELLTYGETGYTYDNNGNLTEVQSGGVTLFRYCYSDPT